MENTISWANNIKDTISIMIDEMTSAQSDSVRLLNEGKIYEFTGNPSKAIDYYQKANENKSEPETKARLSLALLKGGRKEEALRIALDLVEAYPKETFNSLSQHKTSTYTVLGDALKDNGHRADALDTYLKALKIETNDPYAAGSAAALLIDSERVDEAIELADKFKVLDQFQTLSSMLELLKQNPQELPAIRTRLNEFQVYMNQV